MLSEGKFTTMHRFRVWAVCVTLAAGSAAAWAAGPGDAKKGKEVFERCAVCHNADSDEQKMPGTPALKGLFKKEKLTSGKKPTEANVRAKIDEGGNGMPPFKDLLDDTEKNNLIAYLKTL
jgi:cytochrome c